MAPAWKWAVKFTAARGDQWTKVFDTHKQAFDAAKAWVAPDEELPDFDDPDCEWIDEDEWLRDVADGDVAALLGCDLSGTKRAICTQLEQRLLRDGGAAQPPSAWSLRVAASEVTGAGEGVHLRGSCEAGTVLACYPGVIFLPDDLPVMHQLVLTGAHD